MLSGDFVLGFLWDVVALGFISMLTLGWCGSTNLLMLCCHRFRDVLLQSFFVMSCWHTVALWCFYTLSKSFCQSLWCCFATDCVICCQLCMLPHTLWCCVTSDFVVCYHRLCGVLPHTLLCVATDFVVCYHIVMCCHRRFGVLPQTLWCVTTLYVLPHTLRVCYHRLCGVLPQTLSCAATNFVMCLHRCTATWVGQQSCAWGQIGGRGRAPQVTCLTCYVVLLVNAAGMHNAMKIVVVVVVVVAFVFVAAATVCLLLLLFFLGGRGVALTFCSHMGILFNFFVHSSVLWGNTIKDYSWVTCFHMCDLLPWNQL